MTCALPSSSRTGIIDVMPRRKSTFEAIVSEIGSESGIVASERQVAIRVSRDVESAASDAIARGFVIAWRRGSSERGWTPAPVSESVVALSESVGWTVDVADVDEFAIESLLMAMEPFSMVEFLEDVLRARQYTEIQYSGGASAFDLSAREPQTLRSVYYETKRRLTTPPSVIDHVVDARDRLRRSTNAPDADLVLVVAGILTPAAAALADSQHLTRWDRAHLASITRPYVVENYRASLRRRAMRNDGREGKPDRGKQLAQRLGELRPGNEDAMRYQELVRDLVEYLFVPPLGLPEFEVRNETGRDRRDIIVENSAKEGPWALFRQVYRADYVVIDAKNHGADLKKRPVLEVAHYLKWYGPGLFAIIAHREGLGPGARATIREQWIASQRMIVAVNTADLLQMIQLRQQASQPEAIIAERIRKFRLSL